MPDRSGPSHRPNVLLVIADDHQAGAIGALGNSCVRTPVLDRLVENGAAFTRAGIMGSLTPAVCAPSRACLLTGRNLFEADAAPVLNRGPKLEVEIPSDAITLPERFRAAGYDTFFAGKWHNDVPALLRSFAQGRRIFHGGMCDHDRVPVRNLGDFSSGVEPVTAAGFSTQLFCGAAVDYLRNRSKHAPFFACIALTSPHDPRTPPPEFRALYNPEHIALPENFSPEHEFDNGELDSRDELLAARPRDPAEVRRHLAGYYGMISHHDAWLGRMLDTLREAGELEHTIVVYVSDHGLALGSHGLLGKQNLYEHSVRVPLIFSGPAVPAGVRHDGLVYSLDLYATLCELCDVPEPLNLESRSLVPAFAGNGASVRETLCAAYMDCQRMIVDRRWKLIRYRVNGGGERAQLFDLANDPHELRDLASLPGSAAQMRRLQSQLASWQEACGDRWMRESTLHGINS